MDDRRDGAQSQNNDEKHEKARQMTEDAMDAMVKGDQAKASELVDKAKQTDSSAVEEVIQDLDEDASSDHSVPKENR